MAKIKLTASEWAAYHTGKLVGYSEGLKNGLTIAAIGSVFLTIIAIIFL